MANRLAPAPPRFTTTRKNAASASMRKCAPIHGNPTGSRTAGAGAVPGQQLGARGAQDARGRRPSICRRRGGRHRKPLQSHAQQPRGQQDGHARERHGNRHGPLPSPRAAGALRQPRIRGRRACLAASSDRRGPVADGGAGGSLNCPPGHRPRSTTWAAMQAVPAERSAR